MNANRIRTDTTESEKPAQQAVFDMAYNLGVSGLVTKFPTCTAAIRKQDWMTCARECHRTGIQEERNEETENLFLAAANEYD